LAERYQSETAAGRKESSTALYAIYWSKHILPALGARKARDITRADVAKLHAAIAAGGHHVTANRVLTHLRAFYNWAADDAAAGLPRGFVNPTAKIERFREFAKERYLTGEELCRLGAALRQAETTGIAWPEADAGKPKAKHAPKRPEVRRTILAPTAAAAIRLLLFTGARLREILHLRWQEVDLERGLLHLGDSKTGKKSIVLSAPAMEVLATLPRMGRFVIASESAGRKDERPRADLQRPWKLVCRAAGLEGVRIHDLRHSFASVGAAGNLGLPIIGTLLGHRSPDVTQRYAHLADSPLRAAADRIAATIAARLGGSIEGEPLAGNIVPFPARSVGGPAK
jgi:integrase